MIRRLGIGCVLVAALAMPAGAAAKNSPGEVKNAAKHCKSLRTEMGRDAFREEFGTNESGRNAFGKCVAKNARGEHRAAAKALRACKAEYEADPVAFMEKYGSDEANASFERPGGPVEGGEGDRPSKPEGDPSGDEPVRPGAALRRAMHRCVLSNVKSSRSS
jgi:hypothetical protein